MVPTGLWARDNAAPRQTSCLPRRVALQGILLTQGPNLGSIKPGSINPGINQGLTPGSNLGSVEPGLISPGIEHGSPALQADSLPPELPGKSG